MLKRLALLLALSSQPVLADPLDELLTAAHAGDFATVGDQIANAPDRTAQRDLVWALAASDPATIAFTEAWVASDRDNPMALAAQAWSTYWAASKIRGERVRRHTWPPLLEESGQMYGEALAMARRATELDPRFLPASDAVILISKILGQSREAVAELERIMAVDPNRHSLVLTAAALTPAWGGSVDLMKALCDYYADTVVDAPGFDRDTCLAQAVLRGSLRGEVRDWAISVVTMQVDMPFLEREVLRLVRDNVLSPLGVQRLAARLKAEGRMSVYVLLSGQEDPLQLPDMPDKPAFALALKQDISKAALAADRDPGYLQTLLDLVDLYRIEADFTGLQVLRKADPTEADIQTYTQTMDALLLRQATDLDQRARRLLDLSPRDTAALHFAAEHVLNPHPDPLEADRWAMTLMTNATIYAAYQERTLGKVVTELKKRYQLMRDRMEAGDALAYGDDALDEVYLCPYVRAVRLVDEVCAKHEYGVENCLLTSIQSAPSESSLSHTLYSTITERGACKAEREAPIETLLYDLVDLEALP